MKQLVIFIPIFLFLACKNKDRFANKIKTLDSLHVELDKKTAVFSMIDPQQFSQSLTTFQKNLVYVSDSLKDTLPKKYFIIFNQYKSCEAPFLFLKENYKSILNESLLSKEQLKKLSDDLKKDVIEDELGFEYYTIEKMEAEKMSEALSSNTELAIQTLDTFKKYNAEIEKLINAIKNKTTY